MESIVLPALLVTCDECGVEMPGRCLGPDGHECPPHSSRERKAYEMGYI